MTTALPIAPSAAELQARLVGRVADPADPAYDTHRAAWNLSYEHRPSLVAIPAHAADVAAAVGWAAERGMPVAVQATGHGVARPADGVLLILTSELNGVTVDADAWTARVEAGAKWERVLGPAAAAGLAPLLGSTPDVSAVGYTLGGGSGWLARQYGLAADHVRSIDVVTADGVLRHTSPDREPDLFWALRGGGAGSLGVVTAMEIDLVPVPSLYAGNLFYPSHLAREVGARFREWTAAAPDALTAGYALMNFPPIEEIPAPLRGRSLAMVRGGFVGTDHDGEALLGHWREWREPVLDTWGRISITEAATISSDPVDPTAGLVTTEWLDELGDEVVDVLARAPFEQDGPSPITIAEVRHAGGAMARQPEHPNAYGNRERRYLLQLVAIAASPEAFGAAERFVAGVKQELAPYVAGGAYLNFLEGEEKIRRTPEGFTPEAWERLRRIKAHYDPGNVFSHGLAIG